MAMMIDDYFLSSFIIVFSVIIAFLSAQPHPGISHESPPKLCEPLLPEIAKADLSQLS